MDHEHELLKAFATRVAQFSASPDESQVARNLYLSGVFGSHTSVTENRIDARSTDKSKVGIWKRSSGAKDAAFIRRSDRRSEWFYWAKKERIEAKRSKFRVALLGESVARGYLYDPQFTPAAALEEMLRSQLGATEVDVVDLAKSNLTIEQLPDVIGQCLTLQPDVIVVFAGNNWRPHVTEADIPYVDSLLRAGGVPAMKSFLDARSEHAARLLIRQANGLLNQSDVRVIWVVPEFNLDDWADPASAAPILAGQANSKWRHLHERAGVAYRARDFSRTESLSKDMVGLDGGTNSVPLRMLAECCRSNGDLEGVRQFLERSRDAEGWDPSFSYSPRSSTPIQKALREAESAPGNIVVDLPKIFGRHLHGALPSRRIFLDYCHLTTEGINVAMAAVASEVVASLTGQLIPPEHFQDKSVSPLPKVEGKACFLAAVHNAHYYQSYDIVHYWCERALQFWPECRQIMTRLVDFQTRRAPLMACRSVLELFERDELDVSQYLMRGGKQRLDLVLCDAIVASMKAAGHDIGEQVFALRMSEHSLRTGPKELTDFYYSSAMVGPSERAWTSQSFPQNRASPSMYASAFGEASKFVFLGEKGRPVGLKLTYRAPGLSLPESTVGIAMNGHHVTQVPVERTWQTLEVSILGSLMVEGINEVVISWPTEGEDADVTLARAADALSSRRLPRFYRVFGEIHSLLAFDAVDFSGEFCGAGSLNSGSDTNPAM